MRRFIINRAIQSIAIWYLIITFNFLLFRVMPGDPRIALVREAGMDPAVRQRVIARFGLDRPLWEQYGLYIVNLFRGDWGISFSHFNTPVVDVIFGHRLANTVILMGSALLLSIVIGIVMGVVAASRRNTVLDKSSIVFFLVTYSIPIFWMGLLLLLYLGFHLDLIPLAGTITRGRHYANVFEYALDYLWHMVGPTIALALSFIGSFFLLMRDSVLDVFTEDYMEAARAKGLTERSILFKHAMRNAMLPMISVIAVNMTYLISGATMTETVFSWAGLGLLTYNSVLSADYPVLQGIFLLYAAIAVISNFTADVIYAFLDPRIRYE